MISIKIKKGHKLSGDGEKLGKDLRGNTITFWKNMGNMEVPVELAIQLETENPQRYEIVDRKLASSIMNGLPTINPIVTKVVPIDIHYILDQVEKAIELKKSEQIALLNKLNIVPDKRGMEFDRIRKIISSGHKL